MKTKYIIHPLLAMVAFFLPSFAFAKVKKAPDANEVLRHAREAFFDYEFEEASDLFDQYRTLKTKAKQPLDENLEEWERQLSVAMSAFDRVQQIQITDSFSFPKEKFLSAYKLSSSAGKVVPLSGVEKVTADRKGITEKGVTLDAEGATFVSEDGDYIIYSVPNQVGDLELKEIRVLLDGSRETFETLTGDFETDGNSAFPFLGADGQTLYFANDGEESMGGFDIFVAQKDPIRGEFLQPLNLGMPFNSPYNDYMMAIDEEKGVGWFATDRNAPEGNVTIYVYKLEEVRKNYPGDTENLKDYARISDYKSTQGEKAGE